MAALAVTFTITPVMPYTDHDTPESMEAAMPRSLDGFLSLDTSQGYRRLHATDARGNALDMSSLSLVYRRGETTKEALDELLAQFPDELIAGFSPGD
jgi:hypothetical protein